jgi:hypothetical protein
LPWTWPPWRSHEWHRCRSDLAMTAPLVESWSSTTASTATCRFSNSSVASTWRCGWSDSDTNWIRWFIWFNTATCITKSINQYRQNKLLSQCSIINNQL